MRQMITEVEGADILKCIVLPYLLDVIDKYSIFPEMTPLKHVHHSQFQELLDAVMIDHVEAKMRLKSAGIKFEQTSAAGSSLIYKIYFRGYQENQYYWKKHIKSEMSRALGKYVALLGRKENL